MVEKWHKEFLCEQFSSDNLHFDGFLLFKAYKVLNERNKRVICHDTKDLRKVWRKTESWFQKWHEESVMQVVASLIICILVCYFCRKYIMFEQKVELFVITQQNDANFEKKLTCALKNDITNSTKFDPALEILKIYTLMGFCWPHYLMGFYWPHYLMGFHWPHYLMGFYEPHCLIVELKSFREVIYNYAEGRCKLWRKTDLWYHKWHEEFGELHWCIQKS